MHPSLYFFDRSIWWGKCGRGGAVSGDAGVEGSEFLLGEEALFLEADFLATFVTVPEDEEKDCRSCQQCRITNILRPKA